MSKYTLKNLTYLTCLIFSITTAKAEDMDKDFTQKAISFEAFTAENTLTNNSPLTNAQIQTYVFPAADQDSDNYISEAEALNIANEHTTMYNKIFEPLPTDSTSTILESFHNADKNQDNKLNKDESVEFFQYLQQFSLKNSFNNLDTDNNNLITKDELSADILKQQFQNIENLVRENQTDPFSQLNEISPEQMIQFMIVPVENERFEEMDSNQDSCVSLEEYTNYNIAIDEEYDIRKDNPHKFYQKKYNKIPHQTKNCLTKEEYIAKKLLESNINKSLEEKLKEEIEEEFEEIDTNEDNIITNEEHINYHLPRELEIKMDIEEQLKQLELEEKQKREQKQEEEIESWE